MRVIARLVLTVAVVGCLSGGAAAEEPLLLSTAALAERLDDPKLVLLHVGPKPGYDAEHIPGARLVSLMGWQRSDGGLVLQMLEAEPLRRLLSEQGIANDSRVVVYPATGGAFSVATRVLLTLQYAGLKNVSLLDGGLPEWVREKRPVTTEVPAARAGQLDPLKTQPVVVDADFVEAHRGKAGYVVIDARAPSFYDGTETGGQSERPHKTGHIAGARNLPYNTVTNPDGRLKSAAELAAMFEQAGVRKGDTVIGYCHIGQQATAMLFAARAAGYKTVLYDGSFEDWSRRDLPVETTRR